jgi:hypothetical protein
MAEENRRISLAGKVLVDKLDAQLLQVQKQGQVVGFGVALTMAGRFHLRNERSTATYLLYSEDIARLISELLDATTDADPAWRDQVLGLIRLAWTSNAESSEAPLLEAMAVAWARRLELCPPPERLPGGRCVGGLTCGSFAPVVTARARYVPLPAGSACTHRVPAGLVPSGRHRGRLPVLRSSATRTGPAGWARQGRSKRRGEQPATWLRPVVQPSPRPRFENAIGSLSPFRRAGRWSFKA